MAERHRAHCVSLRHCVTPLHHQSTPGDVVVAVDVDVGKSRAVVDAVVVVVRLTSSQRASLTVVATMSTITRNGSHEDFVILPRYGATSALSLCWGHTLDYSESSEWDAMRVSVWKVVHEEKNHQKFLFLLLKSPFPTKMRIRCQETFAVKAERSQRGRY